MSDPTSSQLSRRGFLGVAGGAALAAIGGGVVWNALVRERLEDASGIGSGSVSGRVLVVVQLSGGNDGLNTLIPGNDGAYFDARPQLQVKETDIVSLAGASYGLHPKLQSLVPLWDAGRLVPVDAVGFLQGQTRSHFQASDLWWSAQPGQARTTGWLGRWLDRGGEATNPLRAISLGAGSPALVADRAMSTAVLDPSAFKLLAPKGADVAQLSNAFAATAQPLAGDPDLAAAQQAVPNALHAVDLLTKVSAPTASSRVPGGLEKGFGSNQGGRGAVTDLLDVAAGIIDLQIGTQIIVVGAGGFDTHANQATTQPELLDDLGQGISRFLAAVEQQGRGDHVLVMTTSEFGRRVKENGSGTDHGEGGVQLLAGQPVRGHQVVGQADLTRLDDGDIRSTIDTRSLYAAALDWLGGDGHATDDVLGGSFDRLGLVS